MDFFFLEGGVPWIIQMKGEERSGFGALTHAKMIFLAQKKILCGNATCGNLIHWIVTLIHSWVKMMNSGQ